MTLLGTPPRKRGISVKSLAHASGYDWFKQPDLVLAALGIMIAPCPSNPRRSWLHVRDYGVVVTNPCPKQPRERREPYVKTWVKQGESYKLSYALLIHDLPADKPLDRRAAAESLLQSFGRSVE